MGGGWVRCRNMKGRGEEGRGGGKELDKGRKVGGGGVCEGDNNRRVATTHRQH